MKDKEYHVENFATFVSKTLVFSPKKWMNLISNQLSTASIKYLNWPSPVFGRFQNGCNKVVIEPCAVQFWSEIILVISNRTSAVYSTQFNYHYQQDVHIEMHKQGNIMKEQENTVKVTNIWFLLTITPLNHISRLWV